MAETKVGYVYCLVNGALPGLVKIGVTTKHPIERTRELSAATGVALPFVLAYYRLVENPFAVEAIIHNQLDSSRANDSREFFQIPVHVAISMIERFDEVPEWILDEIDVPYARLFATFPDDGVGRELTQEEAAACRALAESMR